MNVETHSGGNDIPSGENVSLSKRRTEEIKFVCSEEWVYNYRVSSVLIVYWLMGRCNSLKRKMMEN